MSNRPKFLPGTVLMTPGVEALLDRLGGPADLVQAFRRHIRGDWGDMPEEDKAANDASLEDGSRLMSAYKIGGEKVWIITEAGDSRLREVTTFLLPSEY